MKISFCLNDVNFSRALRTDEKADYKKTVHEAKKALGIDKGLSLLKIHSASMPHQDVFDSGMGKLNSKPAMDFIEKMTFYTDTNAIKEFPMGQTTKNWAHFYCPYLKTAVTFGEDNINLLNIVNDKQYGKILSKEDIMFLNKSKNSGSIDYENELGLDRNYPVLKPLKVAYDNFKAGRAPKKLEEEFEEFKQIERVKETYPRLAIFHYLREKEPDLFENFNNSKEKQIKYENYKKQYKDEIEFFKFRQFLAKKEHDEAKKNVNSKGIKLFGDCLIGFSPDEQWAHPDAFEKGANVGLYSWGLPALQFDDILNPDSEAYKLFNDKISFFLENYDGIRFDVGWCYAISQAGKKGQSPTESHRVNLGHKLYDFIEKRAKEIKGETFDKRNLIYEMDVGADAPSMIDWSGKSPKPIDNIKGNMNVLTTEWEHDNDFGWGHPDFFKKIGFDEDEIIMGTNNHDGENLKKLSKGMSKKRIKKRKESAPVLSKLFKIKEKEIVEDPKLFAKLKFAQLFTTKNQFLFFTDVLGTSHDMDNQTANSKNYRFRVYDNFEQNYHSALQKGNGFNLPEVLSYAMKAKGKDKENPELYKKVKMYADILKEKGAKTELDANLEYMA